MTNAVGALVTYVNSANGNWARPVNGMPDIGRVFLIEIPKKGQYDATEVTYMFS
jgi:hypothetical protein